MNLFLNITKWFFTAVGWLLLLILFLMFFPVKADILLEDAVLHLDVKYLFFRLRVLPSKKKKQEREKPEELSDDEHLKEETSDEEEEKEKAEYTLKTEKTEQISDSRNEKESITDTVSQIISLVKRILRPAYWLVRMMLKAVHIKDVSVIVCVTGDDPASVGFRSGLQWSFIGSFMTLLNQLFGKNVTYGEVIVLPCFNGVSEKKEKLTLTVSAQPIIILLIALGAALGYVFELIKDLFSRGGKKDVN